MNVRMLVRLVSILIMLFIAGNTSAGVKQDLAALEAEVSILKEAIDTLQTDLADANTRIGILEAANGQLTDRISELENLLPLVDLIQVKTTETLNGLTPPHIIFHGANIHIRNADENGNTGIINGLGNLIIGYNELEKSTEDRTGSHNLVIGKGHTYDNFGGFVAGFENRITGQEVSVTGGAFNEAIGLWSSVSGGDENVASGFASSVSGGWNNVASGSTSSVSGGGHNDASGMHSSVSGGRENTPSGFFGSINGGLRNEATGEWSSISGGIENLASGDYTTVCGGETNEAFAHRSSILGGLGNETGMVSQGDRDAAIWSCISGGAENITNGNQSSVSGGTENITNGTWSSVSGGILNNASGVASSVSGGENNTAIFENSSVVGDLGNTWADGASVH